MAVGKGKFRTSEVSRSNKIYHKNIYFNKKSFTAMLLSVALLLTSVDCMKVQAEELKDQVPPAQTEDAQEPGSVSDNTVSEEGTMEPDYVKNAAGAVIITSFEDLPENVRHIELGEEETLEEAVSRMPATLKAYADVYVAADKPDADESDDEPGEEEDKPDAGGEEQPDDEENKPGTGEEEQPGEGEEGQPGEGGEENPGEGSGDQPGEGEEGQPGESGGDKPDEAQGGETGGDQPGEGEEDNGNDSDQPDGEEQTGEEENGGGDDGEQSGEGDNGNDSKQPDEGESDGNGGDQSGDNGSGNSEEQVGGKSDGVGVNGNFEDDESGNTQTKPGDTVARNASKSFAAQAECQWRLLVATDENADHTDNKSSLTGDESGDGGEEQQQNGSGSDGGDGQQPGESGSGSDSGGNKQPGVGGDGENGDGLQPGDGGDGENGGGLQSDDGGGENAGSEQPGDKSGNDQPGTDTPPGTEGTPGADAGENVGDQPATEAGTGEETLTPAIKNVEIEGGIPVRWECKEAGNEELEEYIFRPTWEETRWVFAGDADAGDVPTIVVTRSGKEPASEVSTEEELAAAFAAGLTSIVLKNDIELTATLVLPATVNIELDGQGYSLRRGERKNEENGSGGVFTGIMISLDGEDYTEETYGTLTLKDITVDGKTKDERADAPAILDRGSLILEEKVVVRDNDNFGTYPSEENADVETILDYGGGIQVYGELTVTEEALVTGNFADEFGGGVYLENGATLYLYADVIKDNSVAFDHGYGADIYAASGSTIYYDSSIDMTREGFYLCEGVVLISMGIQAFDEQAANEKEIFVSVDKNSGYTERQVEELKQALREKGYTVLSEDWIEIDTTDLHDWYVYDHYDTDENCWGAGTVDSPPAAWTEAYKESGDKRKYYPYTETHFYEGDDQIYTIEEWLQIIGNTEDERNKNYSEEITYEGQGGNDIEVRQLTLAKFKEHIYSGLDSDGARMTFVGYGITPNIDFLYYDPQSNGEKVMSFDVDASQLEAHTFKGNGFLVNTGIEDGKLYGYLVYYSYSKRNTIIMVDGKPSIEPIGVDVSAVSVYRLKDVPVDDFHNGDAQIHSNLIPLVKQTILYPENWDDRMSVQIIASPDKIEVRQQPASSTGDIGMKDPVLKYDIKEENQTGYSGFGPLVSYDNHDCARASTFTYSKLRMYYSDAMLEKPDMLSPLEKADFTQEGTQKYFVNLFGEAGVDYGEVAYLGQYQEYMQLMQHEGVALVTDRKTPFESYLGEANGPDTNLFELDKGALPSPEELAKLIDERIKDKTSTELAGKLDQGELTRPAPTQSVGNMWLETVADGIQVRKMNGASFGENGCEIQIRDELTDYYGDKAGIQVEYEILKPGQSKYEPIGTASPGNPPKFTLTTNAQDWPSGRYTVRQRVSNSSIRGFSYFDLTQKEPAPPEPEEPDPPTPPEPEEPDPPTPPEPEEPDPPTPPEPEEPDPPTPPEPEEPDPPTPPEPEEPDPPIPPAPDKPAKPSKPSKSLSKTSGSFEPAAEPYVEETIEISAGEPASIVAPAPEKPEEPEEEKPKEPRTGDMPVATMPVSVGACTAFMMKLRLWLYELETGISEEKKNEILRALAGWAKGGAMIKVYMAIAATAVVLTAYHLLRALDAKRRQALAWFGRKG